MAAKKPKKAAPKQPPFQLFTPFTAHILSRDWERVGKLNDELKQEIWRKRALDPEGLYRSNMAGTWHSNDSLLRETGRAGQHLEKMFGQAMVQWGATHGLDASGEVGMKLAAWAMIYSDRGYATVHTHPNCHVSAVYYVDDTTPDEELTMATGVRVKPGDIEFINPMPREWQSKDLRFNPNCVMSFKKGRMLVFPSNLGHFVHPVKGPGERIAVACNGTFHPLPPKEQ